MQVRFDARFGGPPGATNGGVVAGTLAGERAMEVLIRRPVPVETDLVREGDELRDAGGELLALATPLDEAAAAALVAEGEALGPVSIKEARAAGAASPILRDHPFPGCFGCGPENPDGLHCAAGPVGLGLSAVAFVPPDNTPPVVWAALDCPSSAPHMADAPGVPHVLGRIAGLQVAPLTPGAQHIVVAASTGVEGRKRYSVSAIRDLRGRTLAVARATWIALTG